MKRSVLIVGGNKKHVPSWVTDTFDVTHYEQQPHFKRPISGPLPDLVIALKSWVSHKQCGDARDYALENGIPFILTDGGFSMAIQRAVEKGIYWFANDIDTSESPAIDDIVERAWESAYKREYEKNIFLEKELRNKREKLDDALKKCSSIQIKYENSIDMLRKAADNVRNKESKLKEIINRQDLIIKGQKQIIDALNPPMDKSALNKANEQINQEIQKWT